MFITLQETFVIELETFKDTPRGTNDAPLKMTMIKKRKPKMFFEGF
jgi:hypothetical protein